MSAVENILKDSLSRLKRDEEHFKNQISSLNAELTIAEKALSKVQSDMKEVEEELSIR